MGPNHAVLEVVEPAAGVHGREFTEKLRFEVAE